MFIYFSETIDTYYFKLRRKYLKQARIQGAMSARAPPVV